MLFHKTFNSIYMKWERSYSVKMWERERGGAAASCVNGFFLFLNMWVTSWAWLHLVAVIQRDGVMLRRSSGFFGLFSALLIRFASVANGPLHLHVWPWLNTTSVFTVTVKKFTRHFCPDFWQRGANARLSYVLQDNSVVWGALIGFYDNLKC